MNDEIRTTIATPSDTAASAAPSLATPPATSLTNPLTSEPAPDDLDLARRELAQWRQRAAEAAARAESHSAKVKDLESALAQSREQLAAEERARQIDHELIGIGAIDLETARLVADWALAQEPSADVAKTVRDLRRRKPFLFRGPISHNAPANSDPAAPTTTTTATTRASEAARESGDRTAVMRYLRLKRGL